MNVWTGTARVVANAETRYAANGSAVCTVRLVADSGYGDRRKPLWMRGVLFGKRAEGGLVELLVKGQQLAISGELSMNEWENKDGIKQQSLEINLANVDLVGGRNGGESHVPDPPSAGGFDDSVPF